MIEWTEQATRQLDQAQSGTRELVIANTPFNSAYAVSKAHIVILAIYHGAQLLPQSL